MRSSAYDVESGVVLWMKAFVLIFLLAKAQQKLLIFAVQPYSDLYNRLLALYLRPLLFELVIRALLIPPNESACAVTFITVR